MIYCKDKDAEEKIKEMEKTLRRREFKESYIRDLVAMQKGELGVSSQYYKGNIAEGNWSLIVKDEDIEKLNKGYDEEDSYLKVGSIDVSKRKKDAEYEYIFIDDSMDKRAIEILKKLKTNPKFNTKVIVMIDKSLDIIKNDLIKDGFYDCIFKEEIDKELERILD